LDFYFAPDGGRQDEGLARLEGGGAVYIASPLREWYGLDVGDTIRLQTLQGPVNFEVAGVTLNLSASGYNVIGTLEDAVRYFGTDQPDIFAIELAPDADPRGVGQHILERWGDTYNLRFETLEEFQTRTRQLSESFFALSNATVLVGVAVAALGVVNTLLMNVLERRREIGLLRSLGMTHGQIIGLVLSESAALGVLGGALGLALGSGLSRFAVVSSTSVSGYQLPYVFPVQALVTCVVIALIVPPLAGLWPAWRGARANIVEAMRSE
jgi:putative ABC transport system permease protein